MRRLAVIGFSLATLAIGGAGIWLASRPPALSPKVAHLCAQPKESTLVRRRLGLEAKIKDACLDPAKHRTALDSLAQLDAEWQDYTEEGLERQLRAIEEGISPEVTYVSAEEFRQAQTRDPTKALTLAVAGLTDEAYVLHSSSPMMLAPAPCPELDGLPQVSLVPGVAEKLAYLCKNDGVAAETAASALRKLTPLWADLTEEARSKRVGAIEETMAPSQSRPLKAVTAAEFFRELGSSAILGMKLTEPLDVVATEGEVAYSPGSAGIRAPSRATWPTPTVGHSPNGLPGAVYFAGDDGLDKNEIEVPSLFELTDEGYRGVGKARIGMRESDFRGVMGWRVRNYAVVKSADGSVLYYGRIRAPEPYGPYRVMWMFREGALESIHFEQWADGKACEDRRRKLGDELTALARPNIPRAFSTSLRMAAEKPPGNKCVVYMRSLGAGRPTDQYEIPVVGLQRYDIGLGAIGSEWQAMRDQAVKKGLSLVKVPGQTGEWRLEDVTIAGIPARVAVAVGNDGIINALTVSVAPFECDPRTPFGGLVGARLAAPIDTWGTERPTAFERRLSMSGKSITLRVYEHGGGRGGASLCEADFDLRRDPGQSEGGNQ